ncbi:MAG: hypothetical protein V3V00_15845 [Saprospiraceae bacterium]
MENTIDVATRQDWKELMEYIYSLDDAQREQEKDEIKRAIQRRKERGFEYVKHFSEEL